MIETSVIYPSVDAMLAARGVHCRTDGSYAEDSYDFGVWWRDEDGAAYRLTWIGGRLRGENPPPGELYLVRLDRPVPTGGVELLCVVPPVPGETPDENVERILNGWAEVCGLPNSRAWIYDRTWEALKAGWARDAREEVVFDVG